MRSAWELREGDVYDGELKRVRLISATLKAFAALLYDGSVVTWGTPRYGGRLRIVDIHGSRKRFSAEHRTGNMTVWGDGITSVLKITSSVTNSVTSRSI